MSILAINGVTFQPDGIVGEATITPVFNSNGTITVPNPDTSLTYADQNPPDPDTWTISQVDLSAATSYRLGTASIDERGPNGDLGSFPVDIVGANAHQVLFGIPPYDPVGAASGNPYQQYVMVSNVNINNPTYPFTFSFDANAYPCFARGTRIATPSGEIAVECLAVGDLVRTATGEDRPIVWVGHRHIDITRHANPDLVRPVRIAAGALGENVPARDLVISPDHNLFIEGVLIPAKCLVNGSTISAIDVASVTYHHVELATHDVVLAEGAAAETYLDTGNRCSFVGQGVVDAHPDFASAPDVNFFAWESKGCARLVVAGPEIERARAILAERSVKLTPADVETVRAA